VDRKYSSAAVAMTMHNRPVPMRVLIGLALLAILSAATARMTSVPPDAAMVAITIESGARHVDYSSNPEWREPQSQACDIVSSLARDLGHIHIASLGSPPRSHHWYSRHALASDTPNRPVCCHLLI
jgi:hypothetical protein